MDRLQRLVTGGALLIILMVSTGCAGLAETRPAITPTLQVEATSAPRVMAVPDGHALTPEQAALIRLRPQSAD